MANTFGYICNPLTFLINFQRAEEELKRIQNLQNHLLLEIQVRNVLKGEGFGGSDLGAYALLGALKYQLTEPNKESLK